MSNQAAATHPEYLAGIISGKASLAGELSLLNAVIREQKDEIERLRKIEKAARNVAETLNGGFVVCQRCGEQETTTDLDYAPELYAALGPKPPASP
jgi:hypothetical protein